MYNMCLSSKLLYILFYIFVPYISLFCIQYRHKNIVSQLHICCVCAYVIWVLSLRCSWLTGVWKFYKQMCSKTHLTLKSNISENATNKRLSQIRVASIDASFIFTSSALAGLIRPTVSEIFFLQIQNIYLFYTRSVLDYWSICITDNSSPYNLS